MREAPSRVLMESLWVAGAMVQAYDPEAMEECPRIYGNHVKLMLTGTLCVNLVPYSTLLG
jgi:UDPglucose 6-dehydrogenase